MTCRDAINLLSEYLDGALAAPQQAQLEEHLAECPECREYLTTFAQTIRLAKAAFATADGTTIPDMPERLVQAILAARRP